MTLSFKWRQFEKEIIVMLVSRINKVDTNVDVLNSLRYCENRPQIRLIADALDLILLNSYRIGKIVKIK